MREKRSSDNRRGKKEGKCEGLRLEAWTRLVT